MPDLGPKPRADVEVASLVKHYSTAEHDDADYDPDSVFMNYRVPASTPQDETPAEKETPASEVDRSSGDEATDGSREPSDRSYEPRPLERDDRSEAGERERHERFSPLATPIVRHRAERDRPVDAASAAPSVPSIGDPTSGGEATSRESTSRGAETRATGEWSLASGARTAAREDAGAARAPGHPPLTRLHDAPITEIGATPPARADLGAPSALILGLTLLALVVSSVIAVVAVRRRRGGPNEVGEVSPPWVPPVVDAEARARDLFIEAELQEMIAEHRAHQSLPDGLLEPSPAWAGEDVPESAGAPADGSLAGVGQS